MHVKIGRVDLMRHTAFPHMYVLAAMTALEKVKQSSEDQSIPPRRLSDREQRQGRAPIIVCPRSRARSYGRYAVKTRPRRETRFARGMAIE